MSVRVLIPLTPGTNCDKELGHAFELAGAKVEFAHLTALLTAREPFAGASVVALPGGFSFGDDVASGKIYAVEMGAGIAAKLRSFVDEGGHVLGICNGFQILVKSGLLPGFEPGRQDVTLTHNRSGRFEDRWVTLESRPCRARFVNAGDVWEAPVAHGEGQFLARDNATLDRLVSDGLVAFRYVNPDGTFPAPYPANPNGSALGIAGICDLTGRVLGLMPHPERNVEFFHHPEWTRRGTRERGAGFRLVKALVDEARRLT